jgi:hypothetical protein
MRIQIIAILVSASFLIFILELIRKEKIREAYGLLWLFWGGIFLILSIWRDGLDFFGRIVGIAYSPTALILVMLMGIILILIQYSVVVSSQTNKIKHLTQELGLLSLRIQELEQTEQSDG